ncbi:MAG: sugar phosphate nucleotidyltransferase [Deltaproteobacteria bacterium]|nr:sugar phosphate nucleotidyltransferase [Deltaproteobacteria bacterium]
MSIAPRRAARPRFAVVMAGGAGTRFWPLSRARHPKQFLRLDGPRTLLQESVFRLRGVVPARNVLVVAPPALAKLVRRQLPDLPPGNLVLEPSARGTAACLALAAAHVAQRDANALMAVVTADHVIRDRAAFRASFARAFAIATDDASLVTFGIPPAAPETGFGYVRLGEPLAARRPRVFRGEGFVEKPDLATARRYLASRRWLWNSGMFVWRVDVFRAALATHAAATMRVVDALAQRATAAARRAYGRLPAVPIDVAVMERAPRIAVVEATFDWNDVGSWAAMPALWGADAAGNTQRGEALLVDCRNTVVRAERRLVAVLGAQDLVVVDTPDVVLVCPRARVQEVRRLVAALRGRRARFS